MNKATKGAMAAGAAALLLLGGAGSLALWSDTEVVDGGSINTGTLDINAVGAGEWTDISDGRDPETIDIADFKMVPGDTVRYTTNVLVTAIGDNLDADVVVGTVGGPMLAEGPSQLVGTDVDNWVEPPPGVFTIATSALDTSVVPPTVVSEITEADNGKTIEVSAVITFNADAQVGVNTSATFENFNITVNQVRTPVA